jgi:hypothetical protein
MTSATTALGIGAVALAVSVLAWYLKRCGLFKRPKVSFSQAPTRRVAYKHHVGPYKKCGPFFNAASDDLATAKSKATTEGKDKKKMTKQRHATTFATFFDDPVLVPAESLRYAVGMLLSEGDETKPDRKVEAQLASMGYTIVDLPACKAVTTDFPFFGMISIWLAVRRVYPLIYGHVEKNKLMPKGHSLACYEIYSCATRSIQYILPVDDSVDLSVFMLGLTSTTNEYAKSLKKEGLNVTSNGAKSKSDGKKTM